jgi:hypothetical protein
LVLTDESAEDLPAEDRSCQVDHPIRVVVGRALLTSLMRAVIVEKCAW